LRALHAFPTRRSSDLKDSAGPRTVQSVELQSERAATVSTDGQEPGVGPLLEANANRSYFLCKRCLDVCLAGVILFLLVPVLLFIDRKSTRLNSSHQII